MRRLEGTCERHRYIDVIVLISLTQFPVKCKTKITLARTKIVCIRRNKT
jgi:hypothetical protein